MIKRIRILALSLAFGLTATVAWADFKWERKLALEPGGSFVLETDIEAVVLTGDTSSGARVLVTSDQDLDRDFDFAFNEDARGVKLTIKRRGMRRLFSGWFQTHDTRIAIQVPTRTAVRLSTSGGSVDATRVTGTVNAHTSGGSVRVEAVEGNVEGTTSGGGIRMRDVRGDVVASTSGGSITIADIRGSLRANTSGGGITIDEVSGHLRASTSGGSVDVRGAGGRVEASSSGGGVTVRFAPGNSRGGVVSSSGGSCAPSSTPAPRSRSTPAPPVAASTRISRSRFKGRSTGIPCAAI